jgi:NADPH2:quinone reductase
MPSGHNRTGTAMSIPESGLQLRSTAKSNGELEIALARAPVPALEADQILVRVEATPINPSDLGLLFGRADPSSLKQTGTADDPAVSVKIPEKALPAMAARLDKPMPVGNEGAGTVIAAGASPAAQALMGKTVAMIGGAMWAQYRVLRAADVLLLGDDATATDGASCFVNPLTAQAMVEVMRLEGHTALVHTAAASNLGQMLVKICLADGVELVNVVRNDEQVKLLKDIGAKHVVNSSAPDFMESLIAALTETGATIAFDAIGGGRLASQILTAMEAAAAAKMTNFSVYGSSTFKQVYIYGGLDVGPTELTRNFGFSWSVSGFLLTPFLMKAGPEVVGRLRKRVVDELKTTFASHYTRTISLKQALDPQIIAQYAKRATGEKFLINPSL